MQDLHTVVSEALSVRQVDGDEVNPTFEHRAGPRHRDAVADVFFNVKVVDWYQPNAFFDCDAASARAVVRVCALGRGQVGASPCFSSCSARSIDAFRIFEFTPG